MSTLLVGVVVPTPILPPGVWNITEFHRAGAGEFGHVSGGPGDLRGGGQRER